MQQLWRFGWQYKGLGLAVLTGIVAAILDFFGQVLLAHWLLGIVTIVVLITIVVELWHEFQHGVYGLNLLAPVAAASALVLRSYWVALLVLIVAVGSKPLEVYARRRAGRAFAELQQNKPGQTHIIRGSKLVAVAAEAIHSGDKLLIGSGEMVPVDATIFDGEASFDDAALTGDDLSQLKRPGDLVASGSINLSEAVTVRAVCSAADSQYQRLLKLSRAAQTSQPPFARLAEYFGIGFTVAVLLVAGAMWYLSGEASRFLQVVVVATPTPLLLATPLAFLGGLSRSSKYGIFAKSSKSLELAATMPTLAFGKTGVLTVGRPSVTAIAAYHGYSQAEVLSAAASLEQTSEHALAGAVITAAHEKQIKYATAKHVQTLPGRGLHAHSKNKDILIGQYSLLQEHDITFPAKFRASKAASNTTYIAIDGKLAGTITFADELQPTANHTLAQLKRLGVSQTILVTGSQSAIAESVANAAGIDEVRAEASPGSKLRVIAAAALRPIGFVSSGKDTAALTAADVGIYLAGRQPLAASSTADVVILHDDISYVALAVAIAKRSLRIAKQTILAVTIVELALLLVFASGKLSPLIGIILQALVTSLGVALALRAGRPKAL